MSKTQIAAIAATALIIAALAWIMLSKESGRLDASPPLPTATIAASEQSPPDAPFVDITKIAGVDFSRNNGARGERFLPETMGGGVAFLDYDNDGLSDLFLVDGGDWPHSDKRVAAKHRLYRNLGDGRFEDRSAQSGVQIDIYGMGVAIADYDANGWPDILITGIGGARLLKNQDGHFTEVSAQVGVSGEQSDWSTAAVFFDADNDSDLDLFVCNYVAWSPQIDLAVNYQLAGAGRAYGPPMNFSGAQSRLYLQNAGGTFDQLSSESGIEIQHPNSGLAIGKALGVIASDFNDDGFNDLLVANDTVRNFLFINRKDGTFEEQGVAWGLAFDRDGNATGAMGIDSGWIGTQSKRAILIGNFANEMSSLYVEQAQSYLYSDDAMIEGLGSATRQVLTFGTLLFDFDLDGRLDLLQTNGHIEELVEQVQSNQHYRQPGQLFWNCGERCMLRFVELPAQQIGALATPIVGRGSAYADIDNDGDLDIAVAAVAGEPLLLRNNQSLNHHFLTLRLRAIGRNRDALGARVWLHTADGIQQAEVGTTRGYLSSVEPLLHFGLGASPVIEFLKIRWPDGQLQTVQASELRIDQRNEISQGTTLTVKKEGAAEK